MTEQYPDGDAFGLTDSDNEGTDDIFGDPIPPAPEADVSRETEPEPEVETPKEETPEVEPEPEPEPEGKHAGEPTQEEGVTFAGRTFPTQEEAERSYKEMQAAYTRERQEAQRRDAEMAQMRGVLQQMAPILQQVRQQALASNPRAARQAKAQELLEQMVQQKVQEQVTPALTAAEAQAQEARAMANISAFYQRTDLEPNSPQDEDFARFVEQMDLDVADGQPDTLDVAYEVFRDPNLRLIVEANPEVLDDDRKLEYARRQARLMAGVAPGEQGTGTPPKPQATPGTARRQAHVETGGTGAPPTAPGTKGDEFDEALRAYKTAKEGSVFGV